MIWFIIFFLQLILIFLISHFLKQKFFITLYASIRKQSIAISLISLLLYPGVVVHEFSHLIAAVILFVRVRGMSLVPKVVDGKIQGGSVVIEKVDVFRRTIVGIAPLFGGLGILWLIIRYFLPLDWTIITSQISFINLEFMNAWNYVIVINPLAQFFIVLYLVFSISSTMYSSQKDLEALLYLLPLLIVGIVFLYIFGFQAVWIVDVLSKFEAVFVNLSMVLGLILTIQLGIYALLFLYSTITKPIRSG